MADIVPELLHLVVLTHDVSAALVPQLLSGPGLACRAATFHPREAARALIAATDPDLVVIEDDGYPEDLIEDLLRTWPNLGLLMISRNGTNRSTSSLVDRGVDDVLPQADLTAATLERAIRHAVARRRRAIPLNVPLAALQDAHLALLINLIPDAVAVIDAAGMPVAVNDALCALLNCSREEALHLAPGDLFRESGVEARGTSRIMTAEGRLHTRGRLVGKGRTTDVDVTTQRVRNNRYEVVFRDVGPYLQTETALRESEARFRVLADSSPTAIYIEQDQRVVYVNPVAAALVGVPGEHLLGTDPIGFADPNWRKELEDRRRRRLAGEEVDHRYELKLQSRDGHERWLDMTVAFTTYRSRPALLVNALDVTERKRLEEQLFLNGRLDAIGRLAGGIAHDFNNLLQVVNGHVERLLEDLLPTHPARDSVAAIRTAAARATSLTEQLLAVGRRQVLLPKSTDLNELVSRFVSTQSSSLPPDIRVRLNPGSGLPPVRIDAARLEQALAHLLSNAREAMPLGGDLTITTRLVQITERSHAARPGHTAVTAEPGTYVSVDVSDTGYGMTSEVLAQAFEPFYTTKPNAPGAGLGLSTVYGIIKQSGGYVSGESAPGKGTKWSLWLPAAVIPPIAAPAPDSAPVAGHVRVLLVEDEEAVRTMLADWLKRDGLDVTATASAEEALEAHSRGTFDVLVSDVGLPKVTGPELAREILNRTPGIRVIFISGYVADEIGRAGIDPTTVFLQKPFSPRELARRVRQVAAEGNPGQAN